MSYTRVIVCLANSWKYSGAAAGRCIAGRTLAGGQLADWVRPISSRPGHEISIQERTLAGGGEPVIGDVVEIGLLQPSPQGHQQENELIDSAFTWKKVGRVNWSTLQAGAEAVTGPLWHNGTSSNKGLNDAVPAVIAPSFPRSLYLVKPDNLVLTKALEAGYGGTPAKTKVRARFDVAGHSYNLSVTDPVTFQSLGDGQTSVANALLCISLPADDVRGNCYKLVATVITPATVV